MGGSNLVRIELIFICRHNNFKYLFFRQTFKIFKITCKVDFLIFRNLFKSCIFAVYRNVTGTIFFSSDFLFGIFFLLLSISRLLLIISFILSVSLIALLLFSKSLLIQLKTCLQYYFIILIKDLS